MVTRQIGAKLLVRSAAHCGKFDQTAAIQLNHGNSIKLNRCAIGSSLIVSWQPRDEL
jgi:hypothetical protein